MTILERQATRINPELRARLPLKLRIWRIVRSVFQPVNEGTGSSETEETIKVPPAELSAPGDYRNIRVSLTINGETRLVPAIKQTYAGVERGELQGNCAEYAMINTALLLIMAGFRVNQDLENLLYDIFSE